VIKAAYEKAAGLREQILKGGDFETLANEIINPLDYCFSSGEPTSSPPRDIHNLPLEHFKSMKQPQNAFDRAFLGLLSYPESFSNLLSQA
jgi:hypothetical protein